MVLTFRVFRQIILRAETGEIISNASETAE